MGHHNQRPILVAIVFILLLGVELLLIGSSYRNLGSLRSEIAEARQEKRRLQDRIATGPRLRAERDAARATFEELVTLLPSENEFATHSRVLSLLSDFALESGVFLQAIRLPGTETGSPEAGPPNFTPHTATVELTGTFFELMAFLNELETHQAHLHVRDLIARPTAPGTGRLNVEMELATYSYNG